MHILLAILLLLLNVKRKTLKNLDQHYISVLYVGFFNLFYYYTCKHFILWDYKSNYMNIRWARGLHLFVIMPLITLLFLSRVPNSSFKKVLHTMKWVTTSVIVEWFGLKKFNAIYFLHGWNIRWSALMYILMYSFSLLILNSPTLVGILSVCSVVILIVIFKVPFRNEFLMGPIILGIRKLNLFQKDKHFIKSRYKNFE